MEQVTIQAAHMIFYALSTIVVLLAIVGLIHVIDSIRTLLGLKKNDDYFDGI